MSAPNWTKMKSAPRDGTIILAKDRAGNQGHVAFRDGCWRMTMPGGLGGLSDGMPFAAREWDNALILQGSRVYVSSGGETVQFSAVSDATKW